MNSRKSYTAAFKLDVLTFAEKNGVRAASREFSVQPNMVRYWRNQTEKIRAAKKGTRSFRGPKKGRLSMVDDAVMDWVEEKRKEGSAVTCEMIQMKAREIARQDNNASDFKASRGWVVRLMRRKGFSLRRTTSLCQRLPADYTDKVLQFQRFVLRQRGTHQYMFSQIGNADETPLYFEMPRNTTVNKVGERSVLVKTTGAEKMRCTVMLAITADGRKLPPYVIFKRKTLPKGPLPKGIHVRVQDKGWMDSKLMHDWLEVVWKCRPGGLLRKRCLLVLDSFRGHIEESVKNRMKELNTHPAIIPGGLTSILQPLDVSVNKPFKDHVKTLYTDWMANGEHSFMKTGKIQKPSIEILCSWIVKAWDQISSEIIQKSFKKTGISNALDGTEDHLIYEDSNDPAEATDDDGDDDNDGNSSDSD